MNSVEKEISYQTTNSYTTLNTLTETTKNVWFVCHGMSYLSRYFLKYFDELDPDENYIIAPQAQSKHYIAPKFKHVGASWLTKENTLKETENVMRYFDAVFEAEKLPKHVNLIIAGFSQGVSVSMRYLAKRQLSCSKLLIMSGGIPNELTSEDFNFSEAEVFLIYGKEDEYLDDNRMDSERQKAIALFGDRLNIMPFNGTHIVNKSLINELA